MRERDAAAGGDERLRFDRFVAVPGRDDLGPRIVGAIGERRAMGGGLLAIAAGAVALRAVSTAAPALPSLAGGFVLLGAGLGIASVASTLRGTAALSGRDQGLASGLLATCAQVGTALGLAVTVPIAAARTDALGATRADQVAGYELGFALAAVIAGAAALVLLLPRPWAGRGRAPGRRDAREPAEVR